VTKKKLTNDEENSETIIIKEPKDGAKKEKSRRARRLKPEIKHSYISKHEVLSDEDKKNLSEKIRLDKVPRIYLSDPALSHLEVAPGDIIKITRSNPVIGDTLYYRRVARG